LKASLSVSDELLYVVESLANLHIFVCNLFTDIGLKIIELVHRFFGKSTEIPACLDAGFGSQQDPDGRAYSGAGEKETSNFGF
jgi:hypothetical protein